MLSTLRTRLHDDEAGFTLIELMVVVLIIAILIAIAIPTFLGVQKKAKDRAAQSDVRNAMTAVRVAATDDSGALTSVDATSLKVNEPNIKWVDATGTPADTDMAVAKGALSAWVAVYTKSATGTWFGGATDTSGKLVLCSGAKADVSTFDDCTTHKTN